MQSIEWCVAINYIRQPFCTRKLHVSFLYISTFYLNEEITFKRVNKKIKSDDIFAVFRVQTEIEIVFSSDIYTRNVVTCGTRVERKICGKFSYLFRKVVQQWK